MKSKAIPIKQDLFTFVTGPRQFDQISQQEREENFIHHPDISKSQFLKVSSSRTKKSKTAISKTISLNSHVELRRINPSLFDFSTKVQWMAEKDKIPKEIKVLNKEQLIKVWDFLFYELIERKSSRNRQATIQLIKANHLVSKIKSKVFTPTQLVAQKLIIPIQIIELIKDLHRENCDGESIGVDELRVIDYRRVEQEVCCYVPGEVSHIENILAREFKEKHTRDLVRSELTTESTTEVEIENLTDTSTTTRNELNSEIQQTLEEERSNNFGGSLSVSYGGFSANTNADFSMSNSSSISNTTAKAFAQEIVRKTVEKIVRKTKLKRTAKIIKEFETNNRHGFDNREGTEHVTGIYRWVDIIYTNRLINYGKRLVYKFTIPHPAEFYKMAINFKPKEENNQNANQNSHPKSLKDFGILDFSNITEENEAKINEAAIYYGLNIQLPEFEKIKSFNLNYSDLGYKSQTKNTPSHNEPIDDNYECTKITGGFYVNYKGNNTRNGKVVSWFHFDEYKDGEDGYYCGGSKDCDRHYNVGHNFLTNPIVGNISCYYRYQKVGSLSGTFKLHLKITDAALEEWQKETYSALDSVYQQMLSEYEFKQQELKEQEEREREQKEGAPTNSYDNRITEQRELKRAAIDMMMKPFCKKLGKDFTSDRSCGDYKVPQTKQTEEYAEYIKYVAFFERAFDWNLMSYVFHPYYWADCKNWVELVQTKNADRIFQAFLQAGIAEVVVPIKCEMSLAVAYYLETGDISNPDDLIPEDLGGKYEDIALELQDCHTEEEVEGTWDSRVPTSLNILQKDSALVEEAGLPCCLVDEEGVCCDKMRENDYENTLKPGLDDKGNSKYKLLEGKKE